MPFPGRLWFSHGNSFPMSHALFSQKFSLKSLIAQFLQNVTINQLMRPLTDLKITIYYDDTSGHCPDCGPQAKCVLIFVDHLSFALHTNCWLGSESGEPTRFSLLFGRRPTATVANDSGNARHRFHARNYCPETLAFKHHRRIFSTTQQQKDSSACSTKQKKYTLAGGRPDDDSRGCSENFSSSNLKTKWLLDFRLSKTTTLIVPPV